MAYSSILGADPAPLEPDGREAERLGPSDNSDSGSDTIGSGLPVANLTWRRFQDHGRHCNLQTPLDEAAKNGCQTVTQRCTFPEQ